MEKSKFIFNDCKVCINPNVYPIIKGMPFSAEVRTACKDGKWYSGYSYNNSINSQEGGSSPVSYCEWDKAYETEAEAKQVATIPIINKLRYIQQRYPEHASLCQKLIGQCQGAEIQQLSLF